MDISSALWWLSLNILTAGILGFYSMQEMACVSFNKIRLYYYVNKGMQRAVWLNYLIQNPSRLFGTTLISVNVAMFIGSECARQFYISLGINPDFAPLTQVAFIVIFAELAPMFAARLYAEKVALTGAPILYATAKIMTPLLWGLGYLSRFADYLTGHHSKDAHVILHQEDLQKILSDPEGKNIAEDERDEFDSVASNIFGLRHKNAGQVMEPINTIIMLPSNATVAQFKKILDKPGIKSVPLYHRDDSHIVGIINPRDLLRIPDSRRVREYASPPWFITQHTKVTNILQEFRRNNKTVAIVLNAHGLAVGIIFLADLTEEIFGKFAENTGNIKGEQATKLIIDRTFPGDMRVSEFNDNFDVILDEEEEITLAELITRIVGHNPEVGEKVYIAPFELTVIETSLTGIKKIAITTRLQ